MGTTRCIQWEISQDKILHEVLLICFPPCAGIAGCPLIANLLFVLWSYNLCFSQTYDYFTKDCIFQHPLYLNEIKNNSQLMEYGWSDLGRCNVCQFWSVTLKGKDIITLMSSFFLSYRLGCRCDGRTQSSHLRLWDGNPLIRVKENHDGRSSDFHYHGATTLALDYLCFDYCRTEKQTSFCLGHYYFDFCNSSQTGILTLNLWGPETSVI